MPFLFRIEAIFSSVRGSSFSSFEANTEKKELSFLFFYSKRSRICYFICIVYVYFSL
jgi:hypothetical protein